MNLKEYAEEKGISLTEAKEATGLTHWKKEVVENDNKPSTVETESKEVPVAEVKEKPVNQKKLAQIRMDAYKFRTYLGEASQEYLKHVSCYRDVLPDEYRKAQRDIKEFLV